MRLSLRSIHKRQSLTSPVLYAVLFLFFLQLISDFVEAIYVFGLLGTSIPDEIISVVLLFTPVVLLFFRGGLSSQFLAAAGLVAVVGRSVEVALDTPGRMIASGIGVGGFLVFLPVLLWFRSQNRQSSFSSDLGIGITLALISSILLRSLGSGSDISTYGMFRIIGWFLGLAALVLLALEVRPWPEEPARPMEDHGQNEGSAGGRGVSGLCLGLMAVLVLLYFAFSSLNVISRWTGADYLLIVGTAVLALSALAFVMTTRSSFVTRVLTPRAVLTVNVLLLVALMLTLLAHQISFPADSAAYPLVQPPTTLLHHIPLILMLLTFPVLLLDFSLFSAELTLRRPTPAALGRGFTLASLFLLIVILAQVFATVYDYIPVVGPLFRDKFWLAFLVPGLLLFLGLASLDKRAYRDRVIPSGWFPVTVVLVSLGAISAVVLTTPRPPTAPQKTQLRLLTYNIQQGYDEFGSKNLDGQLKLLRSLDPDVIGLQESDTNRIAGGNADVVRFFADRLQMYSYYGPKVIAGTFGIALLSKYPIEDPRTFYMYSEGEQTAAIEAQISVGGEAFHVVVTHLGNGGPIIQQRAILEEVAGRGNVILMGDFNFRTNSEQYQLTTGVLADAWLLKWPGGADDQGMVPDWRIDHFFVSPGMTIQDARYLTGPESDHPAAMIEVDW